MVQVRRCELERAAAEHRSARRGRRADPPSPLLRRYARLWWAARPRVASWALCPSGSAPLSARRPGAPGT
ncbi:MAG TPA: hypothetical protein VKZ81_30330 [Pseudonocardia sp.]|uniref:hypothetical protein n=1 Tax=Pseudonocardia sp. TaxID=60912 RepID=UPI002B4B5FBB|nr:hypothetical protein [Pseudonocardia sp.]HLU59779.1 hypothetical protein [Pseudonocardia sp.]